MRTNELFAQFTRERQYLNNVTPKTLEWYDTSWKKFAPFIGSALNEGELSQKVKEAQIAMSSQGNLSPHTINTYSRPIQTFTNWLLENGQ
ncbi:MAG: hypothetical protein ABSF12_24050, partial [Bryobacteraceae bacterium]